MFERFPPQLLWILIFIGIIAVAYIAWAFRNFGTGRRRTGRTIYEREDDLKDELAGEVAAAKQWAAEVKKSDAALAEAKSSQTGEIPCPKCSFIVKPPNACEACGWVHPLWKENK